LLTIKKRSKVTGYDVKSLQMTFKYFGSRIIATAGAWCKYPVVLWSDKYLNVSN